MFRFRVMADYSGRWLVCNCGCCGVACESYTTGSTKYDASGGNRDNFLICEGPLSRSPVRQRKLQAGLSNSAGCATVQQP